MNGVAYALLAAIYLYFLCKIFTSSSPKKKTVNKLAKTADELLTKYKATLTKNKELSLALDIARADLRVEKQNNCESMAFVSELRNLLNNYYPPSPTTTQSTTTSPETALFVHNPTP